MDLGEFAPKAQMVGSKSPMAKNRTLLFIVRFMELGIRERVRFKQLQSVAGRRRALVGAGGADLKAIVRRDQSQLFKPDPFCWSCRGDRPYEVKDLNPDPFAGSRARLRKCKVQSLTPSDRPCRPVKVPTHGRQSQLFKPDPFSRSPAWQAGNRHHHTL